MNNAVSMSFPLSRVAQSGCVVLQACDALRDEAALELGAVLDGVTGKQLKRAGVPTMGAYAVSRALNGGDNNPLFRIGCVLITMKRLGMSRASALRLLGWLQELIDSIWPPETEEGELREVLEEDQALDTTDDSLRFRAALGCVEAARKLLAVKRRQIAHAGTVIIALRRRVTNG